MYKFHILKTSYWNNNYEILESFQNDDLKEGMKITSNKKQSYINNGTVNDYTSFSCGVMEYNDKFYHVLNKDSLIYDKDIINL